MESQTGSGGFANTAFDPEIGQSPTKNGGPAAGEPSTYDELSKRRESGVDFAPIPNRRASRKSISGGERTRSVSDAGGPYLGMGKEELLKFSNVPFWRNLRYMFMSVILTGWLALLITVVAIVLTYPSCRAAEARTWWQKTVIYRVYVPSFLDTNCDGVGDLKGVIDKLDYLRDLGVNTISLSPVYKLGSSDATDAIKMSDTHVVDHKDVDPLFGTLDELKTLVNRTHEKGMRITLDFIPNHTSDEHPWFIESYSNGTDPQSNIYRSYYIWTIGTSANQLVPLNNWKSKMGCSAWEKSKNDNSLYLHQFRSTQPDLNLRSEKVRRELEAILKFWLDIGVDGFYVRDANFLFEDYDIRDETLLDQNAVNESCNLIPPSPPYEAYDHKRTQGLSEVFDMLARWRAYLDEYGDAVGSYKILLADTDGSYDNVMDYYGMFNRDGVDFPLNKFSLALDRTSKGNDVRNMVDGWLSKMPENRWANWMGGDDRSPRLADRVGDRLAKPYLILSMLLPGTPYFYYGDEIGLRAISSDATSGSVKPLSTGGATTNSGGTTAPSTSINTDASQRALPMRGPMLWANTSEAKFTSNEFCKDPWMPINPAFRDGVNVETQMEEFGSLWNLFKNLTHLRKGKPSFEYGDYKPLVQDEQVFSFVREFDGERGYLVALNFDSQPASKQLHGRHSTVPSGATVEIVCGDGALHRKGGYAGLSPIKLMPYEGIVVSWPYKAKEL